MNKYLSAGLLGGLLMATSYTYAGKISSITFSGPDDPNHPNVVQITIEGGFNAGDCDQTFAAIRKDDDRNHIISFALAAYASKQSISVVLNESDKYFLSRCTISRISSN
jgi:hypothetical protein